jgi:hypothetical protein
MRCEVCFETIQLPQTGTLVDLLRKEPSEKTSLGIFVKNQQIIGVIAGDRLCLRV